MKRIGLISCVSRKHSHIREARDLYDSPLFKKGREYIEQRCDSWYILSAKYGLVNPTKAIRPYEETLNTKSRDERKHWAQRVWVDLQSQLNVGDHVIVLAGDRYREYLVPLMIKHGCEVEVPMEGLGIGRQLQWLSNQLSQPTRERDINRLYQSLGNLETALGGKRLMSECTGQQNWPQKGIYLFFEPGEFRKKTKEPRVVRVGTHGVSRGSKSTLWNRLRTHRGSGDGLGNHRGSIFRLHVGSAIAARDSRLFVSTWAVGQSANAMIRKQEEHLEQAVSAYIGRMNILWLSVEDESSPASDRAYFERNLIGLLVGKTGPADPPSVEWLGRFSPDERIRKAGLWNLDFLDYSYSSEFLDILDEYILITSGKKPRPSKPLAPHQWYVVERKGITRDQLSLLGDDFYD